MLYATAYEVHEAINASYYGIALAARVAVRTQNMVWAHCGQS